MASAPPRADFTEEGSPSPEKWESCPVTFGGSTFAIPYIIKGGARLEGITVAAGRSVAARLSPGGQAGEISLDLRPLAGIIVSSRRVSYCTLRVDDSAVSVTSPVAEIWDVTIPAGTRTIEIIDNGPADLLKAAPPRVDPEPEPEPSAEAAPPSARPRRTEEKSDTRKAAEQYWKRMDDVFDRMIRIAELSYETNRRINLIVVGIGIVLIANSIAYTWYKQSADAWSIFSGGLGLVSFVALFFTKPQSYITKALGNLAQIQMVYKTHSLEFEAISDYSWEKFRENGSRGMAELAQMNREIERATAAAVKLVQSYVEDKEKEEKEEKQS